MKPNTVLVNAPDRVAIRYVENRRNERTAIAQYTPTATSFAHSKWCQKSLRPSWRTQNYPGSVRTRGFGHHCGGTTNVPLSREGDGQYAGPPPGVNRSNSADLGLEDPGEQGGEPDRVARIAGVTAGEADHRPAQVIRDDADRLGQQMRRGVHPGSRHDPVRGALQREQIRLVPGERQQFVREVDRGVRVHPRYHLAELGPQVLRC